MKIITITQVCFIASTLAVFEHSVHRHLPRNPIKTNVRTVGLYEKVPIIYISKSGQPSTLQ